MAVAVVARAADMVRPVPGLGVMGAASRLGVATAVHRQVGMVGAGLEAAHTGGKVSEAAVEGMEVNIPALAS